jgi:hypothetical protein
MARVDLRCRCGHAFFVGEAQAREPGGVECPACLERVKPPVTASPAGRLPSRAASRGSESSTAKLLAAVVQPVVVLPPSKKKWMAMAGGVLALGVLALVVIKLLPNSPAIDYDQQRHSADEARKRKYEELSREEAKPVAPAAAPLAPAKPAAPSNPASSPAKSEGTTEYKPMPAATAPSPAPAPPPPPSPSTPAAAPAQGSGAALSPESIARLRSELLNLHPFYTNLVLTPAEKARVNAVGASGRGTAEDATLIEGLLSGPKLKAVKDELAFIAQSLPTLERESSENLPVDRITYIETGRVLNCRILEEGTEVVKVSRALAGGVGGQMPLRRDAIRIEKGKGIGTEFAIRWEAVRKGPASGQIELLSWCKDNTLPGQARLVALTILHADPSHALARGEAGLPPDPVKNAEELSKGGLILYQGRNWNPKQLRDKFLSDGYYLLGGSWYSKKEKMITVPGLFSYERQKDKPVNFTGSAAICHETETTYKKIQDTTTNQTVEQPEVKLLRRFYSSEMKTQLTATIPPSIVVPPPTLELETRVIADAGIPAAGTKMTGEVLINVPVGAIILEAAVITTAEVKAGGSIVVYHLSDPAGPEGQKRTKLYVCDPKENQSHVIPPELVRGATEVNLAAVIEQTAAYSPKVERRRARALVPRKGGGVQSPAVDILHHQLIPDYKAILFPSNSNTFEVFRLKVGIAEPAPHLDKVFAANPDALK